MIKFYTFDTINGQAVGIALELMELPYSVHKVDLMRGEQKQTDFLTINPSGRIPVIVDEIDGEPFILSQTGAILIYLAEKSGQLLAKDTRQKARTLQWMQFILSDISTNIFNNFHLKALVSPKQPEAGELLKQRAIKFFAEIESQLKQNTYLIGEELSLADVVAYPAVTQLNQEILNEKHPNISRWYKQCNANQAFTQGINLIGK